MTKNIEKYILESEKMKNQTEILERELLGCLNFFRDYTNFEENSPGFGLVVDSTSNIQIASIASVGFGLTAYPIACEQNLISREEAVAKVRKTLLTLNNNIDRYKGIYPHFIDMHTAKRVNKSEFSTIDTCLLVNGIITVESYFADFEISKYADAIISEINWQHFIVERGTKKQLRMAYNDQVGGAYVQGEPGFIHQWDHYAEQLTMYLQVAFDERVSTADVRALYNGFDRNLGSYKSAPFVFCHGNPLFIHQFSHAWFPFQKYLDEYGFNWFENSVTATEAQISFCLEQTAEHFKAGLFGLSAGEWLNEKNEVGYNVFGSPPVRDMQRVAEIKGDGTIQQYAIAASINFKPVYTLKTLQYLEEKYPQARGKYGYTDGINPSKDWVSTAYLGLDKGITMIMLDNFLHGTTWKCFERSKYIQKAIKRLNFKEIK
ncbi:MAG: glucoamylase family protein [Mycoplasmatales bacterium]